MNELGKRTIPDSTKIILWCGGFLLLLLILVGCEDPSATVPRSTEEPVTNSTPTRPPKLDKDAQLRARIAEARPKALAAGTKVISLLRQQGDATPNPVLAEAMKDFVTWVAVVVRLRRELGLPGFDPQVKAKQHELELLLIEFEKK